MPFLVRIDGKIAFFSEADDGDTQSYSIENPTEPFSFETYSADGFTASSTDDFITAVNSDKFNTVLAGCDLEFDEGFNISTTTAIDLGSYTLSCSDSAADKTIRVTGGNSTVSGKYSWLKGFDKIESAGGTLTIQSGEYFLPEGLVENINVTGGIFTLYDTFSFEALRNHVTGNHAPFIDEHGRAEVHYHLHDYYKRYDDTEECNIEYYINPSETYFKLVDGKFVKIKYCDWVIPPVGSTVESIETDKEQHRYDR